MFRKRYTVVVVGLGGSSAAQRSEINHFRRERDAVAAAADERDRLSVAHGALARNYRVLVERDGVVVDEFAPVASEEPPLVNVGVTASAPGDADDAYEDPHAPFGDEEDVGGDTGTMPVVGGPHDEDAAPQAAPVPEPEDEQPERAPRLPSWDDVPSGRVPEDVLRYFESAVQREEERRRDRHGASAHDDEGGAGAA